jgi:hypothetical protein
MVIVGRGAASLSGPQLQTPSEKGDGRDILRVCSQMQVQMQMQIAGLRALVALPGTWSLYLADNPKVTWNVAGIWRCGCRAAQAPFESLPLVADAVAVRRYPESFNRYELVTYRALWEAPGGVRVGLIPEPAAPVALTINANP